MSERFTVEVDITAKDKTGKALQGAKRGFDDAFKEIASGALRRAGEGLTDFARQIPGAIVDLGRLGVKVETTERRFAKFAGGADQATMFMESFNRGTDNTVDRMAGMASAGRLLQMGLVETGDEMSQIASIATKLGNQTMGAGDRIADFAALLANQSTPRLDNFGISSGRVRARIDELLKSGQALNREQAFKMAVMEEGAKSLERLGDTSDLASVQMDKLQASLATARQELGLLIAEDAASAMTALSTEAQSVDDVIRKLPERYREWRAEIQATTFAHRASNEEIKTARVANMAEQRAVEDASAASRAMHIDLATGTERWEQYSQGIQESTDALDDGIISAGAYRDRQQLLAVTTADQSVAAFEQYSEALRTTEEAQDRAAWAALQLGEQLRQQAETAMDTAEAQLGLAGQYTDFHEDIAKAAEDSTERRADIEQKHQDALVDIAKKGRSSRIKVDTLGLQFDVRIAKGRLAQLIARQEEFNEDTTDLERARTERSILSLGEELHEKTTILQTAQDGFVTMKGQNVNKLLAEEDRQYQESVDKLEESLSEQETAQRKSLGRMVLTHFNAWVEMNLAADGFTTEESQFVTDMRNEISTEYGLITDMAVQQMKEQERRWEATMAVMRGDAASFFSFFIQEFNALPSEKLIRIRTELATPGEDMLGGPTRRKDKGEEGFAAGGSFLVGEQGVEKVTIQPLGGNTFNDTFNIFDTGAMSAVQDQRRRERRREFERTM